jgi:hypothetical protein
MFNADQFRHKNFFSRQGAKNAKKIKNGGKSPNFVLCPEPWAIFTSLKESLCGLCAFA